MALGFSVGDFVQCLTLAKEVVGARGHGPQEYQEIEMEARTLQTALKQLHHDAKHGSGILNLKGLARRQDLLDLITNCEALHRQLLYFINQNSGLGGDLKSQKSK